MVAAFGDATMGKTARRTRLSNPAWPTMVKGSKISRSGGVVAAMVVDNLTVTTEPGAVHAVTAVRGVASAAAITVSGVVRDASNNPITDSARTVTIAIQTDPQTSGAAATLGGTTSVSSSTVDGTYTFSNLTINKENASGMVLRVTCETKTKDTTTFCIYHPVFDTAPFTDSNYKSGLSLINTVDPTGARCLDVSGGAVNRVYDPLDHTRYIHQSTSSEQCPEPAWNAACAFGSDDGYDEASANFAAVGATAKDTYTISCVADAIDCTGDNTGYIFQYKVVAISAEQSLHATDYLISGTHFRANDSRILINRPADNSALEAIAENTPFFGMGVAPINANMKSIVGSDTTAETTSTVDNAQTATGTHGAGVGMRINVGSPLYYGARDTADPRIFLILYHDSDESANASSWRSALGTALGVSL